MMCININGFDFNTGKTFNKHPPASGINARFAMICHSADVHRHMDLFGWDADTVDECENLDEAVRYTSYDGYDFVSLICTEEENEEIAQREINIFISKNYLALVLPERKGARLSKLADAFISWCPTAASRPNPLMYLYYLIFDRLATDYADTLEKLEDEIEQMSEAIEQQPNMDQSLEIGHLRKITYTYKKLLRALSYIGGQMQMDENKLLDKSNTRHFHNIRTRLMKLYDFADNLYVLSNELLHTYDSKSSSQMNEMIKKLTVITLFFGPLTVIAGIYGMNFAHMPELEWIYGYPAVLGLMAGVIIFIYTMLKINKWI
jgi:magnesium transporter